MTGKYAGAHGKRASLVGDGPVRERSPRGKGDRAVAAPSAATSAAIVELYEDVQRCAESAGLVYIEGDPPGITRLRRGKGFSYRDHDGGLISDAEIKHRIAALAIPPAWRKVWICPSADGHLLATGEDDRGRKQYLYHPKWREIRDLLNAYRLIVVGERLPTIREHVDGQLRRRTLDRDKVLAQHGADHRLVGNADRQRDLRRRERQLRIDHAELVGMLRFGHDGSVRLPGEVRSAGEYRAAATHKSPRSWHGWHDSATDDCSPSTANRSSQPRSTCAVVTQPRGVTAKDFRTWRGTLTAFAYLVAVSGRDPGRDGARSAVDAAAEELRNTSAVARDHYVHPHLLTSFIDGSFSASAQAVRARRLPRLDPDERLLLAFLEHLLVYHDHLTCANRS